MHLILHILVFRCGKLECLPLLRRVRETLCSQQMSNEKQIPRAKTALGMTG